MSTEFYVDDAGQHRFRVQAANGEIVASSEGYTTEASAKIGSVALARALMPEVHKELDKAQEDVAELEELNERLSRQLIGYANLMQDSIRSIQKQAWADGHTEGRNHHGALHCAGNPYEGELDTGSGDES